MTVKYIAVLTNGVMEQAALFTTVLDFKLSGEIELWPGVKCELFGVPNKELLFVVVPQQRVVVNNGVIVLNTENCLRSFSKLKKSGMKVISKPYYLPTGLSAVLEDRAGNQCILVEERAYEEI